MYYNGSPVITRPTDLTRALLIYVPAHQDQYYRPFEATLNGENLTRFNRNTNGGTAINSNAIIDVASSIISPTATPQGNVMIANGFDNPKLAFFLEFTSKNVTGGYNVREIVTGFTDHVGVTENGFIDPNMVFYVNSRMELKDTSYRNAAGFHQCHHIAQNAEILPVVQQHGVAPLRPEDVLAVAQSAEILGTTGGTLFDNRANMAVIPRASNRNNTIPSYYLSKLVDGVVVNAKNIAMGMETGNGDLWQNSISAVETGAYELSPFVNNMGISNIQNCNRFTFAEINAAWPKPHDFWTVNIPKASNRVTDLRQMTEHWRGGLIETQLAYSLTHALPALMSRLMLIHVEVDVTNMTMDNSARATVLNHTGMFDQAITPAHIQHLENQILIDIVRGIINNKVGVFHIRMNVNLLSNSFFNISVNGQPAIPFAAPMYCEAFYSPMIGDMHKLNVLATSVQEIITNIMPNQHMHMSANNFNNYEFDNISYEETVQELYGGLVNHSVARPGNVFQPKPIVPSGGFS